MTEARRKAPLIGRESELASIQALLDQAPRRGGGLVVVEGEPGIGKTRLVEAVVDVARAQGFEVFAGVTDELEWDRPFGPMLSALAIERRGHNEDQRRAIADLLGRPMRSSSVLASTFPEVRYQVVDRLVDLVEDAADVRPTLLVVEDIHWADPSTFLTLEAIARRASERPLVLLVTCRPGATDPAARRLAALVDHEMTHVRLGPLAPRAVGELLQALTGCAPGERLQRLADGASGNPLLLTELVAGLLDGGALQIDGGVAEVTGEALPDTLRRRVLRELARLDEDARGVVRLGAILGSRFTANELSLAARRAVVDLMPALDAAVSAGVLSGVADRIAFRHDLVRAVIYDQVPKDVRRSVHREVAAAMAGAGASPTQVAPHVVLGAEPGDAEAVRWLHEAARMVTGSSPETALELLDRAVELAEGLPDMQSALLPDRLEGLLLAGRLDDAEALWSTLSEVGLDAECLTALRRRFGAVLFLRSRPQESARLLTEVASGAEPDAVAEALAEAALAQMVAADVGAARATAELAREVGRESGSRSGESLALCVLSRLRSHDLALEESLKLAAEAVAIADRDATGDAHRHLPLFFYGQTLHDLDRPDDVRDVVVRARHVADACGALFARPLYHGLSSFASYNAGRLDAAAAEARAGAELCEEMGLPLALGWCSALVALCALHAGDFDAAAAAVASGERAFTEGPPLLGYDLVVLARARLDEEMSEPRRAFDQLSGAWQLLDQLGARTLAAVLGPDLVRLAVALEEGHTATAVAHALDEAAVVVGLPCWRGAALEARGLVEADVDLLVAAIDAFSSSPRALSRARATEHAGLALCRTADARGHDRLQEAIDLYDACGARRDAGRAAAALRTRGGKPRRSGRHPGTGWEALSPAERDVARLVADGLNTKEIAARLYISPRTVETHVRRMFGKLGVRSRVELAVRVSHERPEM